MTHPSLLPATHDDGLGSAFLGHRGDMGVLGELLSLRQQLTVIAASRAVATAHRLTADVASILEPVWTVLATSDSPSGVGYLRGLGYADAGPEVETVNDAVAHKVIETYQAVNLVAPPMREVWQSLTRPAAALVDSVRAPQRPRVRRPAGDRAVGTLGTTVGPVLPRRLLLSWDSEAEVVPALRRVLRRWCDLARNATGDRREVARLTLAAAMLARGATLDGDTATVKWFVTQWLGLRAIDSRVDGTSAALLEDGWVHRSVDDEFSAVRDTVTDLRVEAAYQHRLHRPVWETQLRGEAVALLTDPIGPSGGTVLADTLVDDGDEAVTAAAQSLLKEDVERILRTLSESEAFVIRARYSGKTLAQISRDLGVSMSKVKRIESKTMSKLRHPSRSQVVRDYLD